LEWRTDDEGREIYQRCVGTASLLDKAKTLAGVRKIMANDVKGVLTDANTTLCKERDRYNKFFERINDALDKREAKKTLDRRVARVEKVDQVRNFRKNLVNDLNEFSPAVMCKKI
jgi:hypothetical protein